MKVKTFLEFDEKKTLVIVDVQKSFRKYFTELYLHKLGEYCKEFDDVYYIFDNHVDGKNPDKDYLYDGEVQVDSHPDIYNFPNVTDIIEKRYTYDVDTDFFKNVLSRKKYLKIKNLEENKKLKKGDLFITEQDTALVYIGNNHKWFHCPKKLYNILARNRGKTIYIVGGSDSECLEDVFITAHTLGVNVKRNWKFIYTATHCPM